MLAYAQAQPADRSATAPPENARRRSDGFNTAAHGLRGVAAVLVLAAHIFGGTARHIYPHRAGYVAAVEHPWYLGTFGVQLFFVISGFVILPSALKYTPAQFAVRRFVRIYPLFLVLSLVFVALNLATNAYPTLNNARTITAGLLFLNLFTGTEQLAPNAWSLTYEIWFYILTGLVVAWVVRPRGPVRATLAVAAATGFLLAFPMSVYFLIGVALRVGGSEDRVATGLTRAGEAACAAAVIWLGSRAHHDYASWAQFRDPVVPALCASVAAYFHLALAQGSATARLLGGALFRYVGDVSYSLYLAHPFAYFALRTLFARLGWFSENIALSMAFFTVAVFAGSFALAGVVHRYLERWPYQRLFHQNVFHAASRRPAR